MKQPKCILCSQPFTAVRFLQRTCGFHCSLKYAKQLQDEAKIRNESKRPTTIRKTSMRGKLGEEYPDYIKNREELKGDIRKAHGFLHCQMCFVSLENMQPHCHHVIFRSEKPNHEFLNDKRNLIILCQTCHTWMHDVKGRRDLIVEQRKLHLLFGEDVLNKSKKA